MSNNDSIIAMIRGTTHRRNTIDCTTTTFDEVKWPTISLQPLFFGENRTAFASHRAIYNEDADRVITVATSSYTIIDHKQLVENAAYELEKAGYKDLDCEVTMINGGDKIVTRFKDTAHPMKIGNEEIYPTFVIKNSYDLSWAAAVVGGIFRQVCSNGAYVGHANGYQRRHIGNSVSSNMDHILTQVTSEMKFVEAKFKSMINTAAKRGVPLNINQLRLSDAEKAKLLNLHELSSGASLNLTTNQDGKEQWSMAEAGHSVFNLYNLVTEFVTHQITNPVRRDALSVATNKLFIEHPTDVFATVL